MNEAEGEAEREDDQDRADGSLRPGRPRRRSRASLGPTGCGASHRETAPARAWKVDRSVAQGRPEDPAERPADRCAPRVARLAVAGGVLLGRRSPWASTSPPGPSASTTTSSGRPRPSSRARRRSATRSASTAERARQLRSSRTSCRSPRPTASPRGLLPFPPLPAVLLLPFVALWGLATDDQAIFTILAAVDVAHLLVDARAGCGCGRRSALGDDGLLRLRDGLLVHRPARDDLVPGPHRGRRPGAAGGRPGARRGSGGPGRRAGAQRRPGRAHRRRLPSRALAILAVTRLGVDRRQFVVGLLFGLAATARLTVIFAAPFFVFVGAGGGWWRRGWSAGLGAAIPVAAAAGLQRRHDRPPRPPGLRLPVPASRRSAYPGLGYDPDWAVEDSALPAAERGDHVPRAPDIFPATLPDTLGVNATARVHRPRTPRAGCSTSRCPLAVPRDIGMSVLLTSPAFLLLIPALRRYGRSRLVTGAALAIVAVVVVNLMHFSQGWVQFGYRFSNDAVPFALPLVALGFERLVGRRPALGDAARDGPGRRLGRRQCLGRRLGRTARMVSRSEADAAARPAAPSGGAWRRPRRRRRVRRVRRRCCPASASGTPASCRPSPRSWARPTRPGIPTYVLLGWLANSCSPPFGEPALRMNLFAALCVAVAAAVTVDLVRALTRSADPGRRGRPRPGPHRAPCGRSARTRRPTPCTCCSSPSCLRLLVAWEDGRPASEHRPAPDRGRASSSGWPSATTR